MKFGRFLNYLNYFVPDHQHPVPGGPVGDVPVQGVLGEDPPAGGADQDRGWVRGQHQEVRLNIFHCTSLNIFRAGDMVKCVQAVLEHHDKMEDNNLPFLQSLDILARSQSDKLDQSTKLAKIQLELVVKQVQNVIDTKQVISAGPFLYTIIQEGTPNSQYYSRPTVLTFLAQFLLQAHVSCSQSKKVTTMPLVLISWTKIGHFHTFILFFFLSCPCKPCNFLEVF